MDIELDFTDAEVKAIEQVSGWRIEDDADMRHAIYDIVSELASFKGISVDLTEE